MTDFVADTAAFEEALAAHDAAFETFKQYATGEAHTHDEFRRAALALRETFAALSEFSLIETLQSRHPNVPLETIAQMVGEDREEVQ